MLYAVVTSIGYVGMPPQNFEDNFPHAIKVEVYSDKESALFVAEQQALGLGDGEIYRYENKSGLPCFYVSKRYIEGKTYFGVTVDVLKVAFEL